jgi:hypothetical protein
MTKGESQHDIVTPPTSYRDSPPLTPPPTNVKNPTTAQIWDAIERYKKGQHVPVRRLLQYRVDELQYQELERELSEDEFCRTKLP